MLYIEYVSYHLLFPTFATRWFINDSNSRKLSLLYSLPIKIKSSTCITQHHISKIKSYYYDFVNELVLD